MPKVEYGKLRVAAEAKPIADQLLARVAPAEQGKVEEALAKAATANGDRFLNKFEAQAVLDAFERAAPSGGPLAGEALLSALADASTATTSLESAADLDGVSAHFTFQESLETKLIAELNDSVARANGRRLDVNMMIFEFQSKEVGTAIADIAKNHPNVTFRIVGDAGQASVGGNNALPVLLKKKLPNVQVKFKKDFAYVWDAAKKTPTFNHGVTKGLNHHKGFATFIDGAPDRLVTGSFNWSDTADEKNYEDLLVFKNRDSATRGAIELYQDEFTGFFNSDTTLSPNNFANFKRKMWNDFTVQNGGRPRPGTNLPDDSYPLYAPASDDRSFDVNGLRKSDSARLTSLVGRTLARAIVAERKANGRFASMDELAERVPGLAKLPADKVAALRDSMAFGSMRVSVNTASLEELRRAGFTTAAAKAIVGHREKNGDFETVEELSQVPGVSARQLDRARPVLVADDIEAFFNSRAFDAPAAGTGYGSVTSSRKSTVKGDDAKVDSVAASVTVAATDLFNRARLGSSINVAMYGMSTTSKEYRSLVAAAERGIPVRVVLNDAYTQTTVQALKALAARGLPIDVRVQSAKTMHEKFGVVGDDVFAGSANFSESSSTKHSEDRFAIKNNAELAAAFNARFDRIWAKSR
jgi:competence ComEA-like helix-hairpin-helix protein